MGASSVLGDQIWVLVVSDSRPAGLEAKIWMLCLELLWRGQMRTFPLIIEEAIPYEKMKLSTGSYMLTLQRFTCLLQVTLFLQ